MARSGPGKAVRAECEGRGPGERKQHELYAPDEVSAFLKVTPGKGDKI